MSPQQSLLQEAGGPRLGGAGTRLVLRPLPLDGWAALCLGWLCTAWPSRGPSPQCRPPGGLGLSGLFLRPHQRRAVTAAPRGVTWGLQLSAQGTPRGCSQQGSAEGTEQSPCQEGVRRFPCGGTRPPVTGPEAARGDGAQVQEPGRLPFRWAAAGVAAGGAWEILLLAALSAHTQAPRISTRGLLPGGPWMRSTFRNAAVEVALTLRLQPHPVGPSPRFPAVRGDRRTPAGPRRA